MLFKNTIYKKVKVKLKVKLKVITFQYLEHLFYLHLRTFKTPIL